ncbi:MAG: exo-alpha-sialidase [Candidatus Binatia bacterium]|nr:exo-alpha-sialidase [Candidatus Binatia bacterium]
MHRHLLIGVLLSIAAAPRAAALTLGARVEFLHPGLLHEVQISGAAVAVDGNGDAIIAWVRREGAHNTLYCARPGKEPTQATRVNPHELPVDSLHQSPGLAIGPQGELYLSWSSAKPKPQGVLFASDLRLSRSLDGGRHFDTHLQVNDERPIAHSFEGIGVTDDGTVLLSWIDSRDGWERAGTYVARIGRRGTQRESVHTLDGETCVCCRVHVATGAQGAVAILWRKVFPGNIRDMVLALSHDGGRSFGPPVLLHADRWQLNACPHRGGAAGIGDNGRIYAAWYTEGAEGRPAILFATSSDGSRFTPPQRIDASSGSIPDHVRLAVDSTGRAVIVWQDATAVHRRILLRYTTDGGRSVSPIHSLSQAMKAYAPDVALSPTGEFVVVWHEEQFPVIKTIVQPVRLGAPAQEAVVRSP